MFKLEHNIFLWALLSLPILWLLAAFYVKHSLQLAQAFGFDAAQKAALKKLNITRFVLFTAGMFLFIIAWTNPQWGTRKEQVVKTSSDVYIALDISRSMLAQDISPSRLERAKKVAEQIIEGLRTERIGLILFAGEAYLQMPLTTDYNTAIVFVRNAETTLAGTQGTSIGAAIKLAGSKYDEDEATERLLIIISDGEDHEGEGQAAAQLIKEEHTTVFTVGIGTAEGAYIPTTFQGKKGYLRDKQGQMVLTTFNPTDLQNIAAAGDGIYLEPNLGSNMLRAIQDRVKKLEKKTYTQVEFTARESYFQWFLLPALILILISFSYNKDNWKLWKK